MFTTASEAKKPRLYERGFGVAVALFTADSFLRPP
jgi:hypothetical protein